ncbi:hypothetical protein Y1Q_0019361 [Alligator mississippiensis]|uniref:Uncharacterized protein n=1 Tax=Alligator mississippiensis TaxID=8496 RepID=A0A151MQX9_ALLMI|nr:hypothetical protein Y1Q_0019361 [Alligator mississippiensis]
MSGLVDGAEMEHQLSKGMQEMEAAFYWDLYTAIPEVLGAMQECIQKFSWVLGEDEGQKLEEEWMTEEINTTLCSFQNGKTPRANGLPKEFYIAFWDQVSPNLLEVYRERLKESHPGAGMEEDFITLLYKYGERQDLKKWHPITLLNSDYKLMAKVLAEHFRNGGGAKVQSSPRVPITLGPTGQEELSSYNAVGKSIAIVFTLITHKARMRHQFQ